MDKYSIDGHKMMYHVDRLNAWLSGKQVYPLYLEVSPSGSCNHRCTYCALDFMEYKPRFLDTVLFKKRIAEMGKLGVKSVMYAGEGEPFLHKDMPEMIVDTKRSGIDVALTSNGVLFDKKRVDACLKQITWIKISINGATDKTYNMIHRGKKGDLGKVMANMEYAAGLRRVKKYQCTLGMQLLPLPENSAEAAMLARKAKEIGMDYLVIKPYSQHPLSRTTQYKDIKYSEYYQLAEELQGFNDDQFNVIFRLNTMKKWDQGAVAYQHCCALPFWGYIDAGGDVWACSIYLTDRRFCLGNIYKDTFKKICLSKKRKDLLDWAAKKFDASHCRINCRMDEVNRYLWSLKNPPAHVNFI
ncbi:MAG: radical SAM protein [Candidatus Omnitrophota bacterium]